MEISYFLFVGATFREKVSVWFGLVQFSLVLLWKLLEEREFEGRSWNRERERKTLLVIPLRSVVVVVVVSGEASLLCVRSFDIFIAQLLGRTGRCYL